MKEILVQLDGSERASVRLRIASELAQRFAGQLTGLFAHAESDTYSRVIRTATDTYLAAAQTAATAFEKAASGAGVPHKWMQLSHGNAAFVVEETTICARYADLTVLGQWDPQKTRVPEELAEQVILHSGRPVLMIPYAGDIKSLGRRVMIAWNASRESTRAVHDALPFLKQAEDVVILAVRKQVSSSASPSEDLPQVDIADHLSAHGIKAAVERTVEDSIGVMDIILSRACDLGSDMLVMGAHSGFGSIKGSGTRFMLRHMTVPVLLSN